MLISPDDLVGQAHVVEAGLDEDLGLAHLCHRNALRPDAPLMPGDGDAFVGLRMGPKRHAVGCGAGLHLLQVSVEPDTLDEEARGREVVDKSHASVRGLGLICLLLQS